MYKKTRRLFSQLPGRSIFRHPPWTINCVFPRIERSHSPKGGKEEGRGTKNNPVYLWGKNSAGEGGGGYNPTQKRGWGERRHFRKLVEPPSFLLLWSGKSSLPRAAEQGGEDRGGGCKQDRWMDGYSEKKKRKVRYLERGGGNEIFTARPHTEL